MYYRSLNSMHFRYECDENSHPHVMILQPISSRLPNFLNKLIPENQEQDQRRWWQILSGLQENLRYVANYLFKVTKLNKGPCSIYQKKLHQIYIYFLWFKIFTIKIFLPALISYQVSVFSK